MQQQDSMATTHGSASSSRRAEPNLLTVMPSVVAHPRWVPVFGLLVCALQMLGGCSPPAPPEVTRGKDLARTRARAPVAPAPQAAPLPIKGRLRQVQGQRVLQVWGTPKEMGYAHGYLLRDEILDVVDNYAFDVIPPQTVNALGSSYAKVSNISTSRRDETQGLIEGMQAAGGAQSKALERELVAADLLVLNSMTDLLAIACSSLSAWGAATQGHAKLQGAPIVVRNLDWSAEPALLRNQVILAYDSSEPNTQKLVSVGFAGYLGCLTCINANGVTTLFNMGYGDGRGGIGDTLGGFAPANLLLRDALEHRDLDGDGANTVDDVVSALQGASHVGSYILHLLEPSQVAAARHRTPALIVEVEADGMSSRRSEDNRALGDSLLAATNHLRAKAKPRACSRYRKIEQATKAWSAKVKPDALWELGRSIRLPEVVHSVMIRPDHKTLDVWLRRADEGPHAKTKPVEHTWPSLFPPRDEGR